ncbi:MAG: J domain-containing protein [Desulfobacteraceae bacterium]
MQEHAHNYVPSISAKNTRRCLACGDRLPPRHRRYCAMSCQQYLLASLNRRTGLLQALSTRYATFYFTEFIIVMDMLLYGVEQIHSYMLPRTPGKKPVEDFCQLSNILGTRWWNEKNRTKKRYLASKQVLEQAQKTKAPVNSVMPAALTVPSVKGSSLIRLELSSDDLVPANLELKIKNAYRRQAKKHHPDLGGCQESFLKIQDAYEKLSQWAKRPTFIRQRGFPDKWFYQGANNRWIKPIVLRKKR